MSGSCARFVRLRGAEGKTARTGHHKISGVKKSFSNDEIAGDALWSWLTAGESRANGGYTPGSTSSARRPPIGALPRVRLPPYSAARSTTIDNPSPEPGLDS